MTVIAHSDQIATYSREDMLQIIHNTKQYIQQQIQKEQQTYQETHQKPMSAAQKTKLQQKMQLCFQAFDQAYAYYTQILQMDDTQFLNLLPRTKTGSLYQSKTYCLWDSHTSLPVYDDNLLYNNTVKVIACPPDVMYYRYQSWQVKSVLPKRHPDDKIGIVIDTSNPITGSTPLIQDDGSFAPIQIITNHYLKDPQPGSIYKGKGKTPVFYLGHFTLPTPANVSKQDIWQPCVVNQPQYYYIDVRKKTEPLIQNASSIADLIQDITRTLVRCHPNNDTKCVRATNIFRIRTSPMPLIEQLQTICPPMTQPTQTTVTDVYLANDNNYKIKDFTALWTPV